MQKRIIMKSWLQRFFDKVNDKYPDLTSDIIREIDEENELEYDDKTIIDKNIKKYKEIFEKLADL